MSCILNFNTVEHRLGLIRFLWTFWKIQSCDETLWCEHGVYWKRSGLGLGWKPPLLKPSISAKHRWVFKSTGEKQIHSMGISQTSEHESCSKKYMEECIITAWVFWHLYGNYDLNLSLKTVSLGTSVTKNMSSQCTEVRFFPWSGN